VEDYAYALKNFTWDGELRIHDISLIHNGLTCTAESFEAAELSVSLFLDLISFAREKDVFFQIVHHPYVEQANLLRTYTTEHVEEKHCSYEALKAFLEEAYPVFRKEDFRVKTGTEWALRFYLAALGIDFFQAKFLCLFAALEILLSHVSIASADSPMAGVLQVIRRSASLPEPIQEMAEARLSTPNMAERMAGLVRQTGMKGVAFQSGGREEVRYRFDELLRIRDEFMREGNTVRFIRGEGGLSLAIYLAQLRGLVRESLLIYLARLNSVKFGWR
jgi:hypothetical protein